MAEIDDILSASLKRVAQPGDATGVADAIRSRVDAGDTGTPAGSSGFGGGGILPWLPWIGMVLVAGLTGASLAATGVFAVAAPAAPASQIAITVGDGVAASGCPGGPAVVTLEHGQRVFAVERSDDSGYLGVRDPSDISRTVWLPSRVVVIDDGQPAVDTLPVGGCAIAQPLVTAAPVVPVPVVPVPVAPAPDTTAPSITVGKFSPDPVYGLAAAPYCATVSSVTVSVSDDVGIASVSGSSTFPGSSVVLQSGSGNKYSFGFSAPYLSGPDQNATVTFVVTDTSGNSASGARAVTVRSSGNCLI